MVDKDKAEAVEPEAPALTGGPDAVFELLEMMAARAALRQTDKSATIRLFSDRPGAELPGNRELIHNPPDQWLLVTKAGPDTQRSEVKVTTVVITNEGVSYHQGKNLVREHNGFRSVTDENGATKILNPRGDEIVLPKEGGPIPGGPIRPLDVDRPKPDERDKPAVGGFDEVKDQLRTTAPAELTSKALPASIVRFLDATTGKSEKANLLRELRSSNAELAIYLTVMDSIKELKNTDDSARSARILRALIGLSDNKQREADLFLGRLQKALGGEAKLTDLLESLRSGGERGTSAVKLMQKAITDSGKESQLEKEFDRLQTRALVQRIAEASPSAGRRRAQELLEQAAKKGDTGAQDELQFHAAMKLVEQLKNSKEPDAIKRLAEESRTNEHARDALSAILLFDSPMKESWLKNNFDAVRTRKAPSFPDLTDLPKESREKIRDEALEAIVGLGSYKPNGLKRTEVAALATLIASEAGAGRLDGIAKTAREALTALFKREVPSDTKDSEARRFAAAKETETALEGIYQVLNNDALKAGPGFRYLLMVYRDGISSEHNRGYAESRFEAAVGTAFKQQVEQSLDRISSCNEKDIALLSLVLSGCGRENHLASSSNSKGNIALAERVGQSIIEFAKTDESKRLLLIKILSDSKQNYFTDSGARLQTLGRLTSMGKEAIPENVRELLRNGLGSPESLRSAFNGLMAVSDRLGSADAADVARAITQDKVRDIIDNKHKFSIAFGEQLTHELSKLAADMSLPLEQRVATLYCLHELAPRFATAQTIFAMHELGSADYRDAALKLPSKKEDVDRVQGLAATVLLSTAELTLNDERKSLAIRSLGGNVWPGHSGTEAFKEQIRALMKNNPDNIAIHEMGPILAYDASYSIPKNATDVVRVAVALRRSGMGGADDVLRDNAERAIERYGATKVLRVVENLNTFNSLYAHDRFALTSSPADFRKGATLDLSLRPLNATTFNSLPPAMRESITGSKNLLEPGSVLTAEQLKGKSIDAINFNMLSDGLRKQLSGSDKLLEESQTLVLKGKFISAEIFNSLPTSVKEKLTGYAKDLPVSQTVDIGEALKCGTEKFRAIDSEVFNQLPLWLRIKLGQKLKDENKTWQMDELQGDASVTGWQREKRNQAAYSVVGTLLTNPQDTLDALSNPLLWPGAEKPTINDELKRLVGTDKYLLERHQAVSANDLRGIKLTAAELNQLQPHLRKALLGSSDKLSESPPLIDLSDRFISAKTISSMSYEQNSIVFGTEVAEKLKRAPLRDGMLMAVGVDSISADQFKRLPSNVRLELAGSEDYPPTGLRKLPALELTPAEMNQLPEAMRSQLTGNPARLSSEAVIGMLANGNIDRPGGPARFLLDESFQRKVDDLSKKAEAELESAKNCLRAASAARQTALHNLEVRTEKGVEGWFPKTRSAITYYIPGGLVGDTLGDPSAKFADRQVTDLFEMRRMEVAMKGQEAAISEAQRRVECINVTRQNAEFVRLMANGDVRAADQLAIGVLAQYGRFAAQTFAPDVTLALQARGEAADTVLGRLKAAGLIQSERLRFNASIGDLDGKGTSDGLKMLASIRSLEGFPPGEGIDAPVTRSEALAGIDFDPRLRKMRAISDEITDKFVLFQRQLEAGMRGDKFESFIKDTQNKGKALQELLASVEQKDIDALKSMSSSISKYLEAGNSGKTGGIMDQVSRKNLQERLQSIQAVLKFLDPAHPKTQAELDEITKIRKERNELQAIRENVVEVPPNFPNKVAYAIWLNDQLKIKNAKLAELTSPPIREQFDKLLTDIQKPEFQDPDNFSKWCRRDLPVYVASIGAAALAVALTPVGGCAIVGLGIAGGAGVIGAEACKEVQVLYGVRSDGASLGRWWRGETVKNPDGTERTLDLLSEVALPYYTEVLLGMATGHASSVVGSALGKVLEFTFSKTTGYAAKLCFGTPAAATLNQVGGRLAAVQRLAFTEQTKTFVNRLLGEVGNQLKFVFTRHALEETGRHHLMKLTGGSHELDMFTAFCLDAVTATVCSGIELRIERANSKHMNAVNVRPAPGEPHLRVNYEATSSAKERAYFRAREDAGSTIRRTENGYVETTAKGLRVEYTPAGSSRPAPAEATGVKTRDPLLEYSRKSAEERWKQAAKLIENDFASRLGQIEAKFAGRVAKNPWFENFEDHGSLDDRIREHRKRREAAADGQRFLEPGSAERKQLVERYGKAAEGDVLAELQRKVDATLGHPDFKADLSKEAARLDALPAAKEHMQRQIETFERIAQDKNRSAQEQESARSRAERYKDQLDRSRSAEPVERQAFERTLENRRQALEKGFNEVLRKHGLAEVKLELDLAGGGETRYKPGTGKLFVSVEFLAKPSSGISTGAELHGYLNKVQESLMVRNAIDSLQRDSKVAHPTDNQIREEYRRRTGSTEPLSAELIKEVRELHQKSDFKPEQKRAALELEQTSRLFATNTDALPQLKREAGALNRALEQLSSSSPGTLDEFFARLDKGPDRINKHHPESGGAGIEAVLFGKQGLPAELKQYFQEWKQAREAGKELPPTWKSEVKAKIAEHLTERFESVADRLRPIGDHYFNNPIHQEAFAARILGQRKPVELSTAHPRVEVDPSLRRTPQEIAEMHAKMHKLMEPVQEVNSKITELDRKFREREAKLSKELNDCPPTTKGDADADILSKQIREEKISHQSDRKTLQAEAEKKRVEVTTSDAYRKLHIASSLAEGKFPSGVHKVKLLDSDYVTLVIGQETVIENGKLVQKPSGCSVPQEHVDEILRALQARGVRPEQVTIRTEYGSTTEGALRQFGRTYEISINTAHEQVRMTYNHETGHLYDLEHWRKAAPEALRSEVHNAYLAGVKGDLAAVAAKHVGETPSATFKDGFLKGLTASDDVYNHEIKTPKDYQRYLACKSEVFAEMFKLHQENHRILAEGGKPLSYPELVEKFTTPHNQQRGEMMIHFEKMYNVLSEKVFSTIPEGGKSLPRGEFVGPARDVVLPSKTAPDMHFGKLGKAPSRQPFEGMATVLDLLQGSNLQKYNEAKSEKRRSPQQAELLEAVDQAKKKLGIDDSHWKRFVEPVLGDASTVHFSVKEESLRTAIDTAGKATSVAKEIESSALRAEVRSGLKRILTATDAGPELVGRFLQLPPEFRLKAGLTELITETTPPSFNKLREPLRLAQVEYEISKLPENMHKPMAALLGQPDGVALAQRILSLPPEIRAKLTPEVVMDVTKVKASLQAAEDAHINKCDDALWGGRDRPTPKDLLSPAEMHQYEGINKRQKQESAGLLGEAEAAARVAAYFKGEGAAKDTLPSSGEVKRGKVLHLVLGPPGAGKSGSVVKGLQEKYGARLIDSDNVKPDLKEYKGGLGTQETHAASDQVASAVRKEALVRGENIIQPVIGKSPDSVHKIIAAARANGYEVAIHLADVPPDVSVRRVYDRGYSKTPVTGETVQQVIPLEYAIGVGHKPRIVFEQLIRTPGLVDAWTRYDTIKFPGKMVGRSAYELPAGK